jgi:hypothetical protein
MWAASLSAYEPMPGTKYDILVPYKSTAQRAEMELIDKTEVDCL